MAQEKPGIMALLSPPISVKLGDITGWPSFSPSLSPSHPEACQRALAFYPSSSPHLHCHQSSPINLCFQLCGCNILLSSLPASALDLLQSNFHSAASDMGNLKNCIEILYVMVKNNISPPPNSPNPLALIPEATFSSFNYLQHLWSLPTACFCFLMHVT